MADSGLIAGASAAALTIAQAVAGALNVGDLKRRVAALARAVEEDLPREIADLAKKIDDAARMIRRQATGSQPSLGIVAEVQSLRDRVTSAERKQEELGRRIDEQRAAFDAHRRESDEAWRQLSIQLAETIAAIRGIEGLGGRSGRRGG